MPEEATVVEPPAKVAKTEGQSDVKSFAEVEKDFAPDERPVLADPIVFHPRDYTLNVVPTAGGRVLMALSDCGLQYFVAGARANAGVKTGRYLFEVRILEVLNPVEMPRRGPPQANIPKQQIRIGFSTKGSSLFLGETDDGIAFDSDGVYFLGSTKVSLSHRFGRDQVVALLLNLDPTSPHNNTVSLFHNGQRASPPQPIPEGLKGKALFPHVAFRNVSLQVHFGPQPIYPLSFKCKTLAAAARDDVEIIAAVSPKDGKYDVVFPIGLPDEGTFDWLESFLKKNPDYMELSDRKIVEWAQKSGLWKPNVHPQENSNDKPKVSFGIQALDELAARRVLRTIASMTPRNYVVMEVKSNLIKEERCELLSRFNSSLYRRLGQVMIGTPPEEYREQARAAALVHKQEKVLAEWKAKKEERKRMQELETARKKQEEVQRKFEQSGGLLKMELEKDEKKEEVKIEIKDEVIEVIDDDDKPPKAELTEEEKKKIMFKPPGIPDLNPSVLAAVFPRFALPDPDEPFAEVKYEWSPEADCRVYVQKWILEHKITTKVEDLNPSEWFYQKQAAWHQIFTEWQQRQRDFKMDPHRQQVAALRVKKEKLWRDKREKELNPDAVKSETPPQPAQGDSSDPIIVDASPGLGHLLLNQQEEDPGYAPVDIFAVEDVCDIGEGEPMFGNFAMEDWTMMTLRFELHLLARSFKRDVTAHDPDRVGIHESNVNYYFNKYYRRQLNIKFYGVDSLPDLLKLISDTVTLDAVNSVLSMVVPEERAENFSHFVRVTEEARRDRQRRIERGDESAKLRFAPVAANPQTVQPGQGQGRVVMPVAGGGKGAWGQQGKGAWPQQGKGGFQQQGCFPMGMQQGMPQMQMGGCMPPMGMQQQMGMQWR